MGLFKEELRLFLAPGNCWVITDFWFKGSFFWIPLGRVDFCRAEVEISFKVLPGDML